MITVLESVEKPHDRTNPYLIELVRSFPPGVEAHYFSWRRAVLGPYDVFHVHWPEVRIGSRSALRTAARHLLFLVTLLRIRLTRRVIVRTRHNLSPHEALPWPSRALVRLCDRWTTVWISLTDLTSSPDGVEVVVPHGHYRDWFAAHPRTVPVPGRILHIGLIRRYKGIPDLLRAFSALPGDDVSLRIVGLAMEHDVGVVIRDAEARDPRITFVEGYVPDEALVQEISASELVVLPFASITNSGSLLLALSLDRPVLVPSIELTQKLAAEVGPGWVLTYEGDLGPQTIEAALAVVRDRVDGTPPDLTARDWDTIGAQHASAFALALDIRRRGRAEMTDQ